MSASHHRRGLHRGHQEDPCRLAGHYGAARICAELADDYNIRCGQKRVARLMRQAGIAGCHRRKRVWTTRRDDSQSPAPDRVNRHFAAEGPNELWVADITYVPTWAGFGYLATVLDVFSRRIVGWSYASHMRTELIVDAIDMAIETRRRTPRPHSSLRPGIPIRQHRVRAPLPPRRDRAVDGLEGRLL